MAGVVGKVFNYLLVCLAGSQTHLGAAVAIMSGENNLQGVVRFVQVSLTDYLNYKFENFTVSQRDHSELVTIMGI